jgi:hypothetical protein
MNAVAKLLSTDGFIQVNKTLIKKVGLHEAILIGELCAEYNYWEERDMLDGGYFYSTRDNIEENTGLSEHYQRKALSTLYELGIILIEKRGLPAKNYYKINFDVLLSVIEESSCQRRRQQDTESVNLNNNKQTKSKKEKVVSKDTTTEFSFGKKSTPKKENLYTKCMNMIDAKTIDATCRLLLRDWLSMILEKYRDRGKVLYANVFKGKLNMLDKYDEKDWADIIRYNIQRGYEGFYPINDYSAKSTDIRKGKAWEEGLSCETYTEEEKREIDRQTAEREAMGEQVWY